jgi:putative resolvase
MKLAAWAKDNGLSYLAAWKRYKAGTLPVRARKGDTGAIIVDPLSTGTCIYVRASSKAQQVELERAQKACERFCRQRRWKVSKVIKEYGLGSDDQQPELLRLLESKPTRIVVVRAGHLADEKHGRKFLEALLPQVGCDLVYVEEQS